ncbi:hypothetical protein ACHAWF_013252 [Thalassiosira exigua]
MASTACAKEPHREPRTTQHREIERRDPRPGRNETQLDPRPEPIRFIAVVGLYHSGTKGMWNSIRENERVAAERGIDLRAFSLTDDGGYPPCGVPLRSDSTIDIREDAAMGDSYDETGVHGVWSDWTNTNHAARLNQLLDTKAPHEIDVFYTWWKHTPPQHPMLACFRPDSLYVVMTRHLKSWHFSTKRRLYDLKFNKVRKEWTLLRPKPQRLPPLALQFDSLYDAWAYYIRGYLAWEKSAMGKNCHASSVVERRNCRGGANEISPRHRNYEGKSPCVVTIPSCKTLPSIYSFATRGVIDARADEDKFVPSGQEKLDEMKDALVLRQGNFFSMKSMGAHLDLFDRLGYSSDESASLFSV